MNAARAIITPRLVREVFVVALAYFLYYVVRSQAADNTLGAFKNAKQVINFEQQLGLFEEIAIQTATLSHDAVMHLSNSVYFYSHWPVVIVAAVWLFLKRPRVYNLVRNAFLLTGGIALIVYFAFPVAPPWQSLSKIVYSLQYSAVGQYKDSPFVNPYAAIPSMRVGIDVLVALGLFLAFPGGRLRYLFFLFPLIAWVSTVTTGMHYVIDGGGRHRRSGDRVPGGSLAPPDLATDRNPAAGLGADSGQARRKCRLTTASGPWLGSCSTTRRSTRRS